MYTEEPSTKSHNEGDDDRSVGMSIVEYDRSKVQGASAAGEAAKRGTLRFASTFGPIGLLSWCGFGIWLEIETICTYPAQLLAAGVPKSSSPLLAAGAIITDCCIGKVCNVFRWRPVTFLSIKAVQ